MVRHGLSSICHDIETVDTCATWSPPVLLRKKRQFRIVVQFFIYASKPTLDHLFLRLCVLLCPSWRNLIYPSFSGHTP